MKDVTGLLNAVERGDPLAAEQLLPLIYEELRVLAARKLIEERPGHTLQATALVHEAYLKLVAQEGEAPDSLAAEGWANRRHFFAAAAQAMQRILVDSARRRQSLKRGGQQVRHDLSELELALPEPQEDLIALDEALTRFSVLEPQAAELVRLRFFLGHTLLDAAEILGLPPRTAHRLWAYARAWLHREIGDAEKPGPV